MLEPGATLAHYRLVEKIGEGGMGIVWKAADTRLGRDVAIKVLPEVFAGDEERLARFEREARLLASLNHPRIAAIHGLEQDGERRLLVLELVEGETLDERLHRGALAVKESLELARQIAEALEEAHETGILHRDLKPANVKVTPAGEVKVLDFGLAKAMDSGPAAVDASVSPTLTAAATRAGVILGTAAYMSPEQARGKAVDRRTDVWAFGCVLFQCLAGRRPFEGETVSDIVARILEREPDWGQLPPGVPQQVRDLLQRCLKKNPRDRLRDLGDARLEIERTLATADASGSFPAPAGPATGRYRPWIWAAAGLIAGASLVVAATSLLSSRSTGDRHRLARLSVPLPEGVTLPLNLSRPLAISPDGRRIVFAADHEGKQQLYLRDLHAPGVRPLGGTEGAADPFFSPDGRSIGFISEEFRLYRMSLASTSPVPLTDDPNVIIGSEWSPDGHVYYTPFDMRRGSNPIWRVPVRGGPPEQVTPIRDSAAAESHLFPALLPDGRGLLYNSYPNLRFDRGRAMLMRFSSREPIEIALPGGAACLRFRPPGHLLYCASGVLHAVPFAPETGEILGSSVVIQESILTNPDTLYSAVQTSDEGALVYIRDRGTAAGRRLALSSAGGELTPMHEDPRAFSAADLSPDGGRVAAVVPKGQGLQGDLWIYDLRRRTFDRVGEALVFGVVWGHDGESVYVSQLEGQRGSVVVRRNRGGRGQPEPIYRSAGVALPVTATPDGEHVVVLEDEMEGIGGRLLLVSTDGRGTPAGYGELSFGGHLEISPDGALVAYTSHRSGSREVFIAPQVDIDGGTQVSRDGGAEPLWSVDGTELYFRQGDDWMVVPVRREPALALGEAQRVLSTPPAPPRFGTDDRGVGVTPEGRLVLLLASEDVPSLTRLEVTLGWIHELDRR